MNCKHCIVGAILFALCGCVDPGQNAGPPQPVQQEPVFTFRPQHTLDKESGSAQFFWNPGKLGQMESVTVYINMSDVDAVKRVSTRYVSEFNGHVVKFHTVSGLLSIGYKGPQGATSGTAILSPLFGWSGGGHLKLNTAVPVDRMKIELLELECISPTMVNSSELRADESGLQQRFVVKKLLMTVYLPTTGGQQAPTK